MALLQFTALISGIQGKLQGSVISRGRSGNVIYNRPTQRKEPTKFQLGIRAGFASASYAWKQLSPAHKLDWLTISTNNPVPNRFSDLVVLSGFDYFKKMLGLRFPLGVSGPIIPDLSVSQPYQHLIIHVWGQYRITDNGFSILFYDIVLRTINNSLFTNRVNVYFSLPVADPDAPYFKTWYLVNQFSIPPNLGAGAEPENTRLNFTMPSGWRAFPDSYILVKTIAFIPSTGKISVEQIRPFMINHNPAPIFPTLVPIITPNLEGECIWDGTDWFFVPWFTSTPLFPLINSVFDGSLSFKSPQSGPSVPSSAGWGPERMQLFTGNFDVFITALPGPPEDMVNDNLIKSGAPPPYSLPPDPHLPMRVRLFHRDLALYGPYMYFARPILFA